MGEKGFGTEKILFGNTKNDSYKIYLKYLLELGKITNEEYDGMLSYDLHNPDNMKFYLNVLDQLKNSGKITQEQYDRMKKYFDQFQNKETKEYKFSLSYEKYFNKDQFNKDIEILKLYLEIAQLYSQYLFELYSKYMKQLNENYLSPIN